ncbi:MAG TPA: tetratricopeptide repeat protein [Bacteroidia bacterium]|nr:tetratricopeptide repeat protein [Bacteroidia bacterium]
MRKLVFSFSLLIHFSCYSQVRHRLDSLFKIIAANPKADTSLAKIYNDIAYSLMRINPDSSKFFVDKGLALSQQLNFKSGEAFAYNTLGVHYHMQADYPRAIDYYEKSRKIKEAIGDKKGMVSSQNNMGIVYYLLGQYAKALRNYHHSLEIQKNLQDTAGMASTYNYIASVFYFLSDYDKALRYYLNSLKLNEKINDKTGIAQTRNNIGIIYNTLGNFDKAIENYEVSLAISKSASDKYNMASAYNNLGSAYQKKKDFTRAMEYFDESLRLAREINNIQGISYNLLNIGSLLENEKKYDDALVKYREALTLNKKTGEQYSISNTYNSIGNILLKLNKGGMAQEAYVNALKIAKEIKAKDLIATCYNGFSSVYKSKGDFKKSYEYLNLYSALRDSILSDEKNKSMAEMQTRFDTDKKEKEIELLTKNKSIEELQSVEQVANIKKQKVAIYSSLGGITLALTLVFFVLQGHNQKKKANSLLEEKNIAIQEQKQILEEKNIQITDSIEYAKSIQDAILPAQNSFTESFTDSFVLFKPKDVVSGDFYWLYNKPDYDLLASIDCVGHGVPGAFMALHSYNLLERIVTETKNGSPAQILDELNKKVLESLNQKNESSSAKHGMDMALIKIKKNTIEFAGARNPLVIISPLGEITEIKADRMYIGGAQGNFTNQKITTEPGSMLYLFTDGYADQKGGLQNKKLFVSELKKILLSVSGKSTDEQKEILQKTFSDWKGKNEQIDDVLIIGIRT